jgi:hypothetical protein
MTKIIAFFHLPLIKLCWEEEKIENELELERDKIYTQVIDLIHSLSLFFLYLLSISLAKN